MSNIIQRVRSGLELRHFGPPFPVIETPKAALPRICFKKLHRKNRSQGSNEKDQAPTKGPESLCQAFQAMQVHRHASP